jgi:hypothetical protein
MRKYYQFIHENGSENKYRILIAGGLNYVYEFHMNDDDEEYIRKIFKHVIINNELSDGKVYAYDNYGNRSFEYDIEFDILNNLTEYIDT